MNRKLKLLLLVISIAEISYAQNTRIGFTTGLTLSKLHFQSGNYSESLDIKAGITSGFFLNIPISGNIMISPALNIVQKGFSTPYQYEGSTKKSTLNYLEFPLNVIYKTKGFFVGAGPAISLGLTGNRRYKHDGISHKENIYFGPEKKDLNRWEYSGNFLTGYQLKNGIMFSFNYNMGFSNVIKNDGNVLATNHYFGFKLGYVLGKK